MADYESAVIVLSTLINEKILQPLTHPSKAGTVKAPRTDEDVSLFHLDFTATIQLEDGSEELIMIELQKAAEPTDIFRFKRYISKNFQHKRLEEVTHHKSQAITLVERPIRLIPIFILNFRIENEINDLLIKVNRSKLGVFKNEILKLLLARDNEIAFFKGQFEQAKEELGKKDEIIFALAQKLKLSGNPDEEIAVLTGLSLEQIKAL